MAMAILSFILATGVAEPVRAFNATEIIRETLRRKDGLTILHEALNTTVKMINQYYDLRVVTDITCYACLAVTGVATSLGLGNASGI